MKHAFRQLLKSPLYAALAIGALALGIGANTVLFSAINALFLRPLPFPAPEKLMRVWGSFPDRGLEQATLSWPRYEAFRDQQQSFAELAAHSFTGFILTGRGEPELFPAGRATERFFPALGVQPMLGRTFNAAESAPGGPHVVLVTHGFWRNKLGARPEALGETLTLNGTPHTIIGVLPPSFGFPFRQQQLWAPRPLDQEGLTPDLVQRGSGFLFLYGRLKDGVTRAQAEEQLRVISNRYGTGNPDKVDAKAGLSVVPMHDDLVRNQRPMFLTLLAAVGCVLLVACANVANLLLARFTARRKEIAIRTALGATRRQIVGAFLTESVLTATLAGLLGMLLALWGLDVLATAGANFIPRVAELRLDARVLGFGCGLTLLTGLALGFVPALHASRTDASESLKDSSRGSTAGRHAGKFRSTLLVAEVALSLVLLVGAALLIDSFRRLQRVDPGFRSEDITTFNLGLPPGQYPDANRQAQFWEQLVTRLRALPGVTHAAATQTLPGAADGFTRSPVAPEGQALPPVNERIIPSRSTITPGFFAALDIPIRRGRDFDWRDRDGATRTVIINETLAKRMFPKGENPIGRRLITGIQSIPREVVGVVGDVRSQGLAEPLAEEMYYPAAQVDGGFLAVVVRSTRPAASLRPEIVATVHSLDAGLPIAEVRAFSEQLAGAIADRRLAMVLLGSFAVLALVLAGMGIYSVIAYSVAQRTNEFGIRLALGAAPGQVVGMVVREGLRLALIGLVIGLGVAFAVTRLMQRMLFDVSATDPWIFGGVALFLCAIAALACLVPALRATKVDPMTALRAE